ncbi:MAG: glycine cleavage system protein [Burkholderiales bacterium]|jgi:glycine cleavage system H protein
MSVPTNLRYTETHEWVRVEPDGECTVGITAYAKDALGDIVYFDLPKVGKEYSAGDACGVVESVKAASDINMPAAGVITAGNNAVKDAPESVNAEPYEAWVFKFKPKNVADVNNLMSPEDYQKTIGV